MNYIIKGENGHYISKDNNGTFCLTSKLEQACKFPSKDKAKNVTKNLPKILHSLKYAIITDEENSSDIVNERYIPVDIDNVAEKISQLSEAFKIIKGNKEWLLQEESRIDLELSDLYHFIENHTFNASEGYKLCKRIKDLRIERRRIKNEIKIADVVTNHTCNMMANGNTTKALDTIDRGLYQPRILVELFECGRVNNV